MKTDNNLPLTHLADYKAPAFTTTHHDLQFDIREERVLVRHSQHFCRIQAQKDENGWELAQEKDLCLDGEGLVLRSIAIDDKPLSESDYRYQDNKLVLLSVPDTFVLTTEVELNPDLNKELSGLYRSNGIYCTQCEAQGFRRISFAQDRPDVLATYRVSIEADQTRYPVLLSNGDLESKGSADEGRHFTVWLDPHPKPTYLFALVAGDLAQKTQRMTSGHGDEIELKIFTESAFIGQSDFALQSLVEAIKWDEKRFNLFYDLGRFNVVAVSDFNMGAMENKSLNIFNTKYVLADPETATDTDFNHIRAVIGHEYFHNWTGNRITCRDWFQLTLKEGLTVFRDQEFSADLGERDLERIDQVSNLRRVQFAEDASPMRHPVQPQSYAAIDNFYTPTVYEKGAEIVRMYHTILGERAFQAGMARYVEKFDGKAARVEDFASSMSDPEIYDFTGKFFDWYTTAGTPKVQFLSAYSQSDRSYILTASQYVKALEPPRALVIPIRFSLMNPQGRLYRFPDGSYEQLLILDEVSTSWRYPNADPNLIPVLMQGFSAPIHYEHRYSYEELAALALFAPDGFARYEALQSFYRRLFRATLNKSKEVRSLMGVMGELMKQVLSHSKFSDGEKAVLLKYPALSVLLQELPTPWDMGKIIDTYRRIQHMLALKLRFDMQSYLAQDERVLSPKYSVEDAGARALRGVCLHYLSHFNEPELRKAFAEYYQQANNMTERMSALCALNAEDDAYRQQALSDFYTRFAEQPLVIDKWFSLQACIDSDDMFEKISEFVNHAEFNIDNPNRFRAFIGSFARDNPRYFHQENGAGYRFVGAQIERIMASNPQVSASMLKVFAIAPKLDATRKAHIKLELERLEKLAQIVDVKEIITRILQEIGE